MQHLVRELRQLGLKDSEIEHRLEMEDEEVERLGELAGLPEVVARTNKIGKSWAPGDKT